MLRARLQRIPRTNSGATGGSFYGWRAQNTQTQGAGETAVLASQESKEDELPGYRGGHLLLNDSCPGSAPGLPDGERVKESAHNCGGLPVLLQYWWHPIPAGTIAGGRLHLCRTATHTFFSSIPASQLKDTYQLRFQSNSAKPTQNILNSSCVHFHSIVLEECWCFYTGLAHYFDSLNAGEVSLTSQDPNATDSDRKGWRNLLLQDTWEM